MKFDQCPLRFRTIRVYVQSFLKKSKALRISPWAFNSTGADKSMRPYLASKVSVMRKNSEVCRRGIRK